MKIVWSATALRRLEEIGEYIALDSPESAIIFVDRLVGSVERLKRFPLSGSNVRESPNLKQVLVQGYRIIYRPKDTKVEIITVLTPYQF